MSSVGRFGFFAAALCLAHGSLYATGDALTNELLSSALEISKNASKIKYNVDYQPFIMSVMEGDRLQKLGQKNLKDALMLFTGIDISVDNVRHQSVIVRGTNPFAYGQTRLIIDGVVVNDRTFDGYNAYLYMPIELIKRIEVVSGPGSFADGENGFGGTISVVTYAENSGKNCGSWFASYGSYGSKSTGVRYGSKIGEWSFFADGYYYKDSAHIDIGGKDILSYSPLNSSLAGSGSANVALETYGLGTSLSNGGFSINARVTSLKQGSGFGNLYAKPDSDARQEIPTWYLEAKYLKNLSNSLSAELKLGYMEDGWQSISRSFPAGMQIIIPTVPPRAVSYPEGYWADLKLKNRSVFGGANLSYTGFNGHTLKAGFYKSSEKNIEIRSVTTNRLTGIGMFDYSKSAPFFDAPKADRDSTKLFVSDYWDISQKLALKTELSSVDGSDFDRQNDYRVALVWQPSESDIFKIMKGTAYRLPAWQELYGINNPARVGNPLLKPERSSSIEAQYIKKLSSDSSFSVDIFYIKNSNLINKINPQNQYRNNEDMKIYGIESEYKKEIDRSLEFFVGYSYTNGETDSGQDMCSAANHMLKSSILAHLTDTLSVGVTAYLVGAKKRVPIDNRESLDGYAMADLALNYKIDKNLSVQLGIKNLTESDSRYPSEPFTYGNDYPTNKRYGFLKFSGRF